MFSPTYDGIFVKTIVVSHEDFVDFSATSIYVSSVKSSREWASFLVDSSRLFVQGNRRRDPILWNVAQIDS